MRIDFLIYFGIKASLSFLYVFLGSTVLSFLTLLDGSNRVLPRSYLGVNISEFAHPALSHKWVRCFVGVVDDSLTLSL